VDNVDKISRVYKVYTESRREIIELVDNLTVHKFILCIIDNILLTMHVNKIICRNLVLKILQNMI